MLDVRLLGSSAREHAEARKDEQHSDERSQNGADCDGVDDRLIEASSEESIQGCADQGNSRNKPKWWHFQFFIVLISSMCSVLRFLKMVRMIPRPTAAS